jgi:hypothetical protein
MTTPADLFNTPAEIDYVDEAGVKHTYKVTQPTRGQEERFVRWLEKRARDDAARAIEDMPPDEAERYAAGVRRDIATGVYCWGTVACLQALQSPDGQVYMAYLVLSDQNPEVDEELARKIYQQRRSALIDHWVKEIDKADPKALAALRRMLRLPGEPQSPSATRRSTTSRGKSKGSRKRK